MFLAPPSLNVVSLTASPTTFSSHLSLSLFLPLSIRIFWLSRNQGQIVLLDPVWTCPDSCTGNCSWSLDSSRCLSCWTCCVLFRTSQQFYPTRAWLTEDCGRDGVMYTVVCHQETNLTRRASDSSYTRDWERRVGTPFHRHSSISCPSF
jgi:hypothetical protein